jgi:hypothetical protein
MKRAILDIICTDDVLAVLDRAPWTHDVRTKRSPSDDGAINMKRVSIRSLMVFVVFAAIGLTSLRNANAWWAGITLLLALAALGMPGGRQLVRRFRDQAACPINSGDVRPGSA